MKLLVLTHPQGIENEAEKITELFKEGLEILHFRKPEWPIEKYEGLLKNIPPVYYKKIVVHSHYKLIEKYNLRGIHLTGKYLEVIEGKMLKELFKTADRKNITVSTSMHSIQEVAENTCKYDYVFLSPLFDSISKEGYSAGIDMEEITEFLMKYNSFPEIMALGGIDETNIEKVIKVGFSGAVLLGAVWKEKNSLDRFRQIKTIIKV
jgi:thiamine-phosphate pyrophosphorylase